MGVQQAALAETTMEAGLKFSAHPSLLGLCKLFFESYVMPGEIVLDMTVGNGHDTLFLSRLVTETGRVYGFDVQAEALDSARALLDGHGNVELFLLGHEYLGEVVPLEHKGRIGAAMFNLGYLPGSSRQIVTKAETTLGALAELKSWLRPGGGASIHLYMGHPGGAAEGEAVVAWAKNLAWHEWEVAAYEKINKAQNREILLLVAKK